MNRLSHKVLYPLKIAWAAAIGEHLWFTQLNPAGTVRTL